MLHRPLGQKEFLSLVLHPRDGPLSTRVLNEVTSPRMADFEMLDGIKRSVQ